MERWLMAALVLAAASDAIAAEPRFGLVAGDGQTTCLATAREIRDFPQPVRIAIPGDALEPQLLGGEVVSVLTEPCEAHAGSELHHGEAPAFYALRVDHPQGKWNGIADFADTADASFHACTSSEGLHFTAWEGAPLRSRRLWSAYAYLGYDVEPTCSDAGIAD